MAAAGQLSVHFLGQQHLSELTRLEVGFDVVTDHELSAGGEPEHHPTPGNSVSDRDGRPKGLLMHA